MRPRSKFRLIPPRSAAPAKTRGSSLISTAECSVEHRVYAMGLVRYLKQIDDGSYAAVVDFAGTERIVQVVPEYWLIPIDALMRLIPVLPPPATKLKPKPMETLGDEERADDDEGDHDAGAEFCDEVETLQQ